VEKINSLKTLVKIRNTCKIEHLANQTVSEHREIFTKDTSKRSKLLDKKQKFIEIGHKYTHTLP